MSGTLPPALATWVLKRVARGNDALIGDLLEEYERRRSRTWFWGQVLSATLVRTPSAAALALLVGLLYFGGSYLTIPGATDVVRSLMERRADGPGPLTLFTILLGGGQTTWGTAFTLGINPYISAACIVQLVYLLWRLRYRRAGRRPRFPLVSLTWLVAILLCMTQAVGFATFLERVSQAGPSPFVDQPGWGFRLTTLLMLTAGTTCLMLISDQISRQRTGNGMLIVFVAGLLAGLLGLLNPLLSGAVDPFRLLGALAINTSIAAAVSFGYQRAIEREMTIA